MCQFLATDDNNHQGVSLYRGKCLSARYKSVIGRVPLVAESLKGVFDRFEGKLLTTSLPDCNFCALTARR